jgi:hypothetical protein
MFSETLIKEHKEFKVLLWIFGITYRFSNEFDDIPAQFQNDMLITHQFISSRLAKTYAHLQSAV